MAALGALKPGRPDGRMTMGALAPKPEGTKGDVRSGSTSASLGGKWFWRTRLLLPDGWARRRDDTDATVDECGVAETSVSNVEELCVMVDCCSPSPGGGMAMARSVVRIC